MIPTITRIVPGLRIAVFCFWRFAMVTHIRTLPISRFCWIYILKTYPFTAGFRCCHLLPRRRRHGRGECCSRTFNETGTTLLQFFHWQSFGVDEQQCPWMKSHIASQHVEDKQPSRFNCESVKLWRLSKEMSMMRLKIHAESLPQEGIWYFQHLCTFNTMKGGSHLFQLPGCLYWRVFACIHLRAG